ncbi:hypothetical protein BGP_4734 [Beggiatoa sp. PS]|nr:hypothetical protein BGP_4734 [Beggiatoa sp. PS]
MHDRRDKTEYGMVQLCHDSFNILFFTKHILSLILAYLQSLSFIGKLEHQVTSIWKIVSKLNEEISRYIRLQYALGNSSLISKPKVKFRQISKAISEWISPIFSL